MSEHAQAIAVAPLHHYTRLDGAELTLPCCNVFRVRDGAVADYRVYMDIAPVYA
jgi:ketosteroid isomerase-like protein